MDTIKVIFDTDPGVDDAMALLFLHYAREVELVGITTTFGNGRIDTTTWNALYLTERFGIDAPVASGPATPLVGPAPPPTDFVHGANGLGDVPLPTTLGRKPDPRPAHRFIIDMVRAHPGEITIVAVGRMTNLALALREDPAIAGLVRAIVIMGGAFGHNGFHGNVTPVAEANIHGDPLAADEVFGGTWPITVVGLDVTQRTQMTTDYLEALAKDGGEAGQFIWDITRFYVAFHHAAGVPNMFVHDSSADAARRDPRRDRGPRHRPDDAEAGRIQFPAGRMGRPPLAHRLHRRRPRPAAGALPRHHRVGRRRLEAPLGATVEDAARPDRDLLSSRDRAPRRRPPARRRPSLPTGRASLRCRR